jgi:hypothetical protein
MITPAEAASLCVAIYDNPETSAVNWGFYEPGTGDHGVCYGIKKIDGIDTITLRGSANFLDWRRDLDAWVDPFVHSGLGPVSDGFRQGMDTAWTEIQRHIGAMVAVEGHSLGAARASILCGLMILDGCLPLSRICFGEPAPGFKQLGTIIAPIKQSASFRNADARNHDLITNVPYYIPPLLAYEHPTPLIDVTAVPPQGDEWGVFGWHHMPLYAQAAKSILPPGSA